MRMFCTRQKGTDTNVGTAGVFIVMAKGLKWQENKMKSAAFSIISSSNRCSIHTAL